MAIASPVTGTIKPGGAIYYQVSSNVGGELSVRLQASGFPARVSLVDGTGRPLIQGEGAAAVDGDSLIDEDVPAGQDFLEVQSLGGGGTYQLTTDLIPTNPAFQTIPSSFNGYFPIGVGDLYGDGIQDLVTPAGIYRGNGDGTFQSKVVGAPLGQSGWTVTGIAVGQFAVGGLPEIAFTDTSPDGSIAELCILQNEGGGQFQPIDAFPIDLEPDAIQAVALGDGIVDLAVADYATGHVALFVGDGQGPFTPGPILDGGSEPVALAAGQTGDGHVDLIVADQGDPNTGAGQGLTVFQEDGPARFPLEATIPLAAAPSALVAGDFGNGELDLAIASSDEDDVSVLLGDRNGTFQADPSTYAVGSNPTDIVACSLRDDGRLDLVTVNQNSDDVSVLLGNGDGTFQPQLRFAVGSQPEAIAAADFNDDGRTDLAVTDRGSGGEISILLGRGDGTFQDTTTNAVGNGPVAVVAADLNHDGYSDVITANYYDNDISVLMGYGDGTFQTAESFPAGASPTALVVGDFNGDGRLDVAVADGGNGDGEGQGVSILMGNGDGTFQAPIFYPVGSDPSSIVAGDFTGDGVLDLAVADYGSDEVWLLSGNGRGGFQTLPPIPLGNQVSDPVSIVAGDFTGDGVLDLAVANENSDNVSILLGERNGDFRSLPPISLGDPTNYPQALVSGDFTGDGRLDLAVESIGSVGPDLVSILLNEGQGTFALMPSVALGIGMTPTSIIAAPLFGGSTLDLAVADETGDAVSLLQGDGQGGFQLLPALDPGGEGAPTAITTGDFNGDGVIDLAIGLQSPNSVAIELNQGDGQFALPASVGLNPQDTPVVADLNGDGVPDVSIVDGSGDILFRQGVPDEPGSFEPPVTVNPGDPSRDIAVVVTSQGTLLASVDADNDLVTLFADRHGLFSHAGSLATGMEPAQVVSADLDGGGDDDLIIRNAGDGTLTIYMSNGRGGFLSPITLSVGPGISDVSVADVNQDGRPDILLANQVSGEVDVILNRGDGEFGSPTLYRAGVGLSAVVGGSGGTPPSILSMDGTVAVSAAALTAGAPPDLMTLNSGAETLGVLTGLGGGRFANPYSLPTAGPTSAIVVADLGGGGNLDLAILGPGGLTIWMGNGHGGFSSEETYDVGPDPTGLAVAYLDGGKLPDLLVGNAFGDILVLLNEGHGAFKPPTITDQSVTLAVAGDSDGNPTFIVADQSRDRVVVETGPHSQPTVLADRTSGLLVPGTPLVADLNGDGIPDLIVPNTGGNDVLVYPGLPGGGYGPALNGGNGFPVGTNPVSVIVADLNGRPDLIVADEGSNEVSVLLNEPEGNSFTFVPGPRLNVGAGPVALLYGDFYGNGIPDLVVSDSGSNNLMVLPSMGDGFFDDVDPTIIPMSESPGLILSGTFGLGTGLDIVALNPGTGDITAISGLATGSPTSEVFSSGGLDPVAALVLAVPGSSFEDLVVANNADGRVALLAGGPRGLTFEDDSSELLNPTGLALVALLNNNLEVYATVEGDETAALLVLSLGGQAATSPGTSGEGLTLLPLRDSSLPLIATLLSPSVDFNTGANGPGEPQEAAAALVGLSTTTAAGSVGQGPFRSTIDPEDEEETDEDEAEIDLESSIINQELTSAPWRRVEMGLDEAFDEFRRETQSKPLFNNDPEEQPPTRLNELEPSQVPASIAGRPRRSHAIAIVDAAMDSLSESALICPAVPTPGYESMTKPRPESSPLISMNRSVLLVALFLTSRTTGLCRNGRGISSWRTGGDGNSPEGPALSPRNRSRRSRS
ncbi:MAG: FG-GAP repeat domain-containing protein [Isosphaeraceae bacterium]